MILIVYIIVKKGNVGGSSEDVKVNELTEGTRGDQ